MKRKKLKYFTRYARFSAVLASTIAVLLLFSCGGGGGASVAVSGSTIPADPTVPGEPVFPAFSYHVSGAAGSDTNPGTADLPLKTISAALAKSKPGDRIGVFSGTYREILQFPRGGSDSSHTISLEAVPGADVRIKGSDAVTGWEPHSGAIWKKTGWNVNSQQVFVDDLPLQQIGQGSPFHGVSFVGKPVLPAAGTGISDMVPGSFWYDTGGKILYIWLTDGTTPDQHKVEASIRKWVIPPDERLSYIELHGLHFSHSNLTAEVLSLGIVNVFGRSWIVSGNTFDYGDFAGISVIGEGHRIESNVFRFNGNTGILINGSDASHNYQPYPERPPQNIVLTGNETIGNNYRKFSPDWQAGGLKGVGCNTVQVIGHKALDNDGPGIWFDIASRNIIVDGCESSRNYGAGIAIEISDNAVVFNNTVRGNSHYGIFVSASDNVSVMQNTLDNNWAGIVLHGMPRAEHPTLKNNSVRNNIMKSPRVLDLVMFHDPVWATGNTSDYNRYIRGNDIVSIAWTDTESYYANYTNLSVFSQTTGQESHSTCAPE